MKAVGLAIACAASRMTATPQMMKKPTSGRLVPPSLKERTLCRTEAPLPTRAPSLSYMARRPVMGLLVGLWAKRLGSGEVELRLPHEAVVFVELAADAG
jgi:hypothetical protein